MEILLRSPRSPYIIHDYLNIDINAYRSRALVFRHMLRFQISELNIARLAKEHYPHGAKLLRSAYGRGFQLFVVEYFRKLVNGIPWKTSIFI